MPRPKVQQVAEEIKYPDFDIIKHLIKEGNGLKAEDAIRLIGFETEPEGEKWDDNFFGMDINGKRFRVKYNTRNREWTRAWSLHLMQDMLKKNWHGDNGETWIFGKSGRALSCQHRLLALIFAEQERLNPKHAAYWKEYWDGPVEIDAVLMVGVSEDQATVNTLDNVKPRTFADVLFSDPSRFKNLKGSQRTKAVKAAEFAIRFLWTRTGRKGDAYSGKLTHSEAANFLNSHPHVIKSVDHIVTEASAPGSVLTKYSPLGSAAGLLYLMGCSNTDGSHYHNLRRQGEVTEKGMDWSLWERACTFWTVISKGQAASIREAVAAISDGEDPTTDEKLIVILRAWAIYAKGGKPTSMEAIRLQPEEDYTKDDEGFRSLKPSAYPELGGIDLGHPKAKIEEDDAGDETPDGEEPSGEEEEGDDTPTPEQKPGGSPEDVRKRVEAALAKRQTGAVPLNGHASVPDGTAHDFTKEENPKSITNKDGVVIEQEGVYRASGIEGQTWKVVGFFPEDKGGKIRVMARTTQTHGKHLPRMTPVDDLLPAEKPTPKTPAKPRAAAAKK